MRASPSSKPVDCPAAPASRQSTCARAMHSACLILGGVAQLAEPPQPAFLAAVEVVLLHLETPGRAT